MRPALFNRMACPTVGGFVRSGMGTRLWVVGIMVPHPTTGWLCGVLPAGHIVKGVWHVPGNTQCSSQGYRAYKWLHVATGARQAHYPVTMGTLCPPVPAAVAYLLQGGA